MALTSITKDFIVKSGLIVGTTATIKADATLKAGLRVDGISTLTGALFASDTLTVTNDTKLSKGLAVTGISTLTGAVYAGSTLSVTNDTTLSQGLAVTGISTLTGAVYAGSTLRVQNDATLSQGLAVTGISTLTGAVFASDTLTVTKDTALQAGLAVTGISTLTSAVYAGSTMNVVGQFTVATNKLTVTTGGNVTAAGNAVIDGNTLVSGLFTATLAAKLGSTLDVGGVTTLTDATAASFGSQTGSLKLSGGEYISKNLVVAATDANTGTLTSNALYVNGGVGVAGSLAVSQDAVFKGNVFFEGPTTYSLSTNTVYTDNLLELHVNGSEGTAWGYDDGKDIGFRFHYYNAADKNAAIVLANDTKWFEFYKDGTESGGVFSSAQYATLKAGILHLVDTTGAFNTASGALTVEGGVGVGGSIFVGGVVTATNFIGGLTGTATQANNLNGGGAGYIPIQSAAGVTTFIAAGTADYQVLTWSSSTAIWASASGTTVGNATNADNVQVSTTDGTNVYNLTLSLGADGTYFGLAGDAALTFDSDTGKLSATSFAGAGTDLTGTANGFSVGYAGSAGSAGYAGSASYAGYAGSAAYAENAGYAGSAGSAGYAGSASYAGYAGSAAYAGYAGSAAYAENAGYAGSAGSANTADNLTGGAANEIPYQSGTGSTTFSSNLTFDGTSLAVGGSGGNITMSGGNISGAADITGTGAVQGATLVTTSTAPTLAGSAAGALNVTGGAKIAKDLYVGTTATIAGTLFVDSDVTINANLNVEGTIFVKGSELSGLDQISGSTGSFVNIVSTGTITANAITANSLTVNGQAAITTATIGNFANGTQITAGPAIGVGKVTNGYTTTYTISNLGVQSATAGTGIALSSSTGSVTITNIGVTSLNSTTGTITIAGGTNISVDSTSTPGTITINNDYTFSNTDTLSDVTGRGASTTATININSTTAGTQPGLHIRNNTQAAGTFGSISGTGAVTIDTFSKTDYTSAKYLVQIIDSGDIHTEEILVIQDGTDVYITEYGIITNAGELGVFDGVISGSNVNITFKPTGATAMTVQVVRQSILTTAATYA